MAKFKLALKYAGSSSEDIVEFEAKSPSAAREKCREVMEENRVFLERAEKLNIYVSKVIEACRLCSYDYKLEILCIDEIFSQLEDKV